MELEALFQRRAGARAEAPGSPVVVIVKKRRAVRVEARPASGAGSDARSDGAGGDKQPRVFVVERKPIDRETAANDAQAAVVDEIPVATPTSVVRRRRRRIDALRAPGAVTRIVFEDPAAPAGTDAEGDVEASGPQPWVQPSAYEGTLAALEAVRGTLALAHRARSMRFD